MYQTIWFTSLLCCKAGSESGQLMPKLELLPHFHQCNRNQAIDVLSYWHRNREILSWPAFVSVTYISHRNAWLSVIWIA